MASHSLQTHHFCSFFKEFASSSKFVILRETQPPCPRCTSSYCINQINDQTVRSLPLRQGSVSSSKLYFLVATSSSSLYPIGQVQPHRFIFQSITDAFRFNPNDPFMLHPLQEASASPKIYFLVQRQTLDKIVHFFGSTLLSQHSN